MNRLSSPSLRTAAAILLLVLIAMPFWARNASSQAPEEEADPIAEEEEISTPNQSIDQMTLNYKQVSSPNIDDEIDVSPPEPTTNDVIRLIPSGIWGNSCVPQYPSYEINHDENIITIDAVSNPNGGYCYFVQRAWSFTVTIGSLPVGDYTVEMYVRISDNPPTLHHSTSFVVSPYIYTPIFSYQGQLLDSDGNPITADLPMTFRLYDVATNGTACWTEEHSAANSISVANGLFHVLLGQITAIDTACLSADTYLELEINGEPLTPRELLTDVAKAVEAETLADGASALGDFYVDGNVGIGTTTPDQALSVIGRVRGANDEEETEYTEIGHGGSHGYINTIGDGRLDFRHDSSTKMSLTDAGDLSIDGNLSVGGTCSLSPVSMRMEHEGTVQAYNESDATCSAGSITSGAYVEANLQTVAERRAGGNKLFSEGDLLCWGEDKLELCETPNDSLVQGVADVKGNPIVLGAEKIKVIGKVEKGDYLVASSVPGYAMASKNPTFGIVIAQALEDFDGEKGLIKAMIRKM